MLPQGDKIPHSDPYMTRRTFLSTAAAATPLMTAASGTAAPPKSAMGIATTSFPYARYREPIGFLDHCHALGAAGVQMQLPSEAADLKKVRAHAEQLGMYIEGMAPMPKSNDTAAFEAALKHA